MNRRACVATICIMLVGWLLPHPAHAAVRYVKEGATGNGSSWTNAYGDLQQALAASSPYDQVWVASGQYTPGSDPSDSFELIDEVQVYGGFYGTSGTEGDPDARDADPATNNTILSGNLGTNGNSLVVVTATAVTETTLLDGFTITGGKGGAFWGVGAGVYVGYPCNATFRNCLIAGNEVGDGGSGGGMYLGQDTEVTVEDCTFQANSADYGAGLYIESTSLRPEIRRCAFVANVAIQDGGGLYNGSFGGLILEDCIFAGNTAYNGGGLVNHNQATVTLVNNLLTGNIALNNGGGIDDQDYLYGVTLRNCTLSENTCLCGEGGGIRLVPNVLEDVDTLVNSIFWGNSDIDGSGQTAQVRIAGGSPDITYCCIQSWTGGGTGNISSNPDFISANGHDGIIGTLDDNLRLVPSSAAIDVGLNGAVTVDYDLDGKDREVDGDGDQAADVDMGSYEYDGVDEDCNENSQHDLEDIYDETSEDCNNNLIPDECDIATCPPSDTWCQDENANDIPDGCDIAGGTSNDCNDNGIPDEAEFTADCNANCVEDSTEITADLDADDNGILDECEYPVHGVWQEDDDFDEGTPINVNYEDVADQLQRNPIAQDGDVPGTKPLPYLWVAASGNGTVVRIRTEDEASPGTGEEGDILGEYRTAPRLHVSGLTSSSFDERSGSRAFWAATNKRPAGADEAPPKAGRRIR